MQKQQYASAQRGIYAVQKALDMGRVDLAKQYAYEVTKIVPAPKKKDQIEVKPIEITRPTSTPGINETIRLTILPAEYANQQTMVVGSKELNQLKNETPEITKQFEKEQKTFEKFQEKVEETRRNVQEEIEKPKKSFFGSIMSFFGVSGLIGAVIVGAILIGVAIFAPTLLPIVISSIVKFVVGIFTGIARGIANGFTRKN